LLDGFGDDHAEAAKPGDRIEYRVRRRQQPFALRRSTVEQVGRQIGRIRCALNPPALSQF
jgi:hypothetical protein